MRKSILLASTAALLAIVGSAHAADLLETIEAAPTPATAVNTTSSNSVGICDTIGTGYFFIPGTETCLKIGGAVESRVGYAKAGGGDTKWASVEARMDIDSHTESEIGAIGSKFRVSLNHGMLDLANANDRDIGVELAYISVGPAYVGYKETLFNTKVGYGDTFDIEESLGSGLNSLGAGVMVDNLGGGFYVGGAVESSARGQWIASYDGSNDVDFVGRFGIAGQSWGSSDVSAFHSKAADSWGIKSTTDFNVLDNTQARLTAAYFDVAGDDAILVAAGAQHAFTEQVKGFAGVGYVANKTLNDPYMGNLGVVYTPAEGLDVSGEVGYSKAGSEDGYSGVLKFVRSW